MTRTPLLFLLLCTLPVAGVAQTVNFEDGFEDGDFTAGPAWSGDTEHFRVVRAELGNLLRLESPDTETAHLSTASSDVEGAWEMFMVFDRFAPSGSNRAEVFLMSDRADLEGEVSGYALQVGQSGDDFFKIVRYDEGAQAEVVLADTTLVTGDPGGYRARVERTSGGAWNLFVGRGYLGRPVSAGSSAVDSTHRSATHFGVRVSYTTSRADKFYFDFRIDPPPFKLREVSARPELLELSFNRAVDSSSVTADDFSLLPKPPSSPAVSFPDPETVALAYPDSLPSDAYELRIGDLTDLAGVPAEKDTAFAFLIYGRAEEGDLLLSEFAWDPPGDAPEYVELVNSGNRIVNLEGWRIADGGGEALISAEPLALFGGERLALTGDSAALALSYPDHGDIRRVPSLPALNNTGDALRLVSGEGATADSLSYLPSWGGADGALERRSTEVPARFRENWGEAPGSPGGSPGLPNRVAADTSPPEVASFRVTADTLAVLVFSERLDSASVTDAGHFGRSPGGEIPGARHVPPDTVLLPLRPPLRNNTAYTFTAENVCDLFGNCSGVWDTTLTWQVIEEAGPGELLINEFMYDPPPGWSEYVEIFNASGKTFSAGRLLLSDESGKASPLSEAPLPIPPGTFLVLAPDETLADSFPDAPLLAMGSAFPVLNNAGDRILLRNNSGGTVDSLRYDRGWGGDEVSLERRSGDLPAYLRWNWSEAPDSAGGSPGMPNFSGPDTTPPRLTELRIAGSRELRLTYSEELEEESAGDPSSYLLDGGADISRVVFLPPSGVRLELDAPLRHNAEYTLGWRGVRDHFGNSAAGDTSFTYFNPPLPGTGDLLISEFMYDPPEGWTEYVELYNASGSEQSLAGSSLGDATGRRAVVSDSGLVVGAGKYLVLAPDETLADSFPGIPLVSLGSGFPALNNGGDRIVVRGVSGEALDSLRYLPGWGGAERALERRSFAHPSALPENWSDAPLRGSPGLPNRIGPDTVPPELLEVRLIDDDRIALRFSEGLSEATVTPSRFRLAPFVPISHISFFRDSLRLELSVPLESGTEYTLSAEGVADPFGNEMGLSEHTLLYIRVTPAEAGDLVISEFLPVPGESGTPEFVEILNRSDKNVELAGWTAGDAAGTATVGEPYILRSGERLVLTGSPDLAQSLTRALRLPAFPSLNDAGDRIVIRDPGGEPIDSLSYEAAEWEVAGGRSMERRDPLSASGDPANWEASRASGGHSAGEPNSVEAPDREPPRMVFARLEGNRVEVDFNEFIKPNPQTVFRAGTIPLEVARFTPARGDRILLRPADDRDLSADRKALDITAENLFDYRENRTESAWIPLAYPPRPGELVINEIMYEPISRPDDFIPDQSEYLELWNTRGHALSLEGLFLHGAPDERGETAPLSPVRSRQRMAEGGGPALLYADTSADFDSSRTARYFDMGNAPEHALLRIDRAGMGLAEGDALFLADSSGTVIDSLRFEAGWHNPDLLDTRGIALEKIDPGEPGYRGRNWGSSAAARGGTPLADNSLRPAASPGSIGYGITLSPDPFSPDGDGHEDHLIISYRLDRPDYLLKVRIYDRYGRSVRTLADGERAGPEGTLVWDGLTDDRRSSRIGFYIITLEAYSASGGARQRFKETAVLARRL